MDAARLVDRVVAGILLAATSPFLLVLTLAVRLSSPGPIFHRATRLGFEAQPFTLYKFRTMVVGAPALGPSITAANDPRITRVGHWLRRSRLDELPQLWNVVRGDMRLVGPRPEDPRYAPLYGPEHRLIFSVHPGITGPSQLLFFDEEEQLAAGDPEEIYVRNVLPLKLASDASYVRQHSLAGDWRILGRTVTTALRGALSRRTRPPESRMHT